MNKSRLAKWRFGFEVIDMIDRRTFSAGLAAGVTTAVLGARSSAQTAVAIRNVVLVHGLYADGSSWSDVIARLQTAGMHATAVQNPLRSFEDDVATARRVLDMQDGPTVLVAHSYGGMVVSEIGVHPKVSRLVYVAARAPDAGENYVALTKRYPAAPAGAGLMTVDGYQQLGQTAFLDDFANGVDPARARVLYAVQPQNTATLSPNAKTTVAAWRTKPSWYAVSKQDRTINPDLERFMASRMKATTIEVDAGHLSLISHPQEITNLILQAAGHAA